MSTRRIRHLITFVTAMFLANNVAAAAYACIAALKGQAPAAIQALDLGTVNHTESAPADAASCFTHCAQDDAIQQQDLTAAVYAPLSVPGPPPAYLVFEFKPAPRVIALAPRVIGPPVTILFHNLRN